jgi:opacity protein-like surface antigen
MKKFLIAAAAVVTLAAGASAAQAKVKFDIHVGVPSYGHGYYEPSYDPYYEPVTYTKQCFWKKVKVVKWVYGERVVVWKKKRVCQRVYNDYGY